ncbi:MAG: choice-of-anchor D domain-containing protein [Spirochaetales bacterium]|nr:choice-of-anchor D domain-containing protein [Spirochaetales bacterium]
MKNKSVFISLTLCLLLLAQACPPPLEEEPPQADGPVIDVVTGASQTSVENNGDACDLGSMPVGSVSVTTAVEIQNTGDENLYIDSITLSDDTCYSISSTYTFPLTIAPAESTPLVLLFNPATTGVHPASVEIISNDEDNSPFIIHYTATVNELPVIPAPVIDVVLQGYPASLENDGDPISFGSMYEGSAAVTRIIEIQNDGTANLTISGLSLTDSSYYSITSSHSSSETVLPGEDLDVEITFTPSAVGIATTAFEISSDDPDTVLFTVNFTATVNEEPVTPSPVISVTNHATGTDIADNGSALSMGTMLTGATPVTAAIDIHNGGNAGLSVTGIVCSNTTYYSVTSTHSFPETIIPGENLEVEITFDPSAAGTNTSVLEISSNDPENESFLVNFTAVVEDPVPLLEVRVDSTQYSHNGTACDLGIVGEGSDKTVTVELKNGGTGTLSVSGVSLSDSTNFSDTGSSVLPTDLDPEETVSFNLVFDPESADTYDAYLQITNSSSVSPFQLNLAGECKTEVFTVTVSVSGQAYGAPANRSWAHVCWIEDESETTLQPLSITNFHFGKSGVALPIWNRKASDTGDSNNVGAITDLDYGPGGDDEEEIDAVTAATVDGDFDITRTLSFDVSTVRKFYILFEADRSYNENLYFIKDRPSYLYKSGLIDLDNLDTSYPLTLTGWMCNGTVGTTAGYDQSPDLGQFPESFKSTYFSTVAGAKYVFVPEPDYLIDLPAEDSNYDDMIFTLSAAIDEE